MIAKILYLCLFYFNVYKTTLNFKLVFKFVCVNDVRNQWCYNKLNVSAAAQPSLISILINEGTDDRPPAPGSSRVADGIEEAVDTWWVAHSHEGSCSLVGRVVISPFWTVWRSVNVRGEAGPLLPANMAAYASSPSIIITGQILTTPNLFVRIVLHVRTKHQRDRQNPPSLLKAALIILLCCFCIL